VGPQVAGQHVAPVVEHREGGGVDRAVTDQGGVVKGDAADRPADVVEGGAVELVVARGADGTALVAQVAAVLLQVARRVHGNVAAVDQRAAADVAPGAGAGCHLDGAGRLVGEGALQVQLGVVVAVVRVQADGALVDRVVGDVDVGVRQGAPAG